jgi:hypothetical protein
MNSFPQNDIKSGTMSNMVGKHEQSYLDDSDQYLVWNNLLGLLVSIMLVTDVVESTEAERAKASLNSRSDPSSSSSILCSTAHYEFHLQLKVTF